VRRAVEWLREKHLVSINVSVKRMIYLDDKGKKAAEFGLPERRIYSLAKHVTGLEDLRNLSGMSEFEFNAALGRAKKLGWIEIKGKGEVLVNSDAKELPEERLLNLLSKAPLAEEEIPKDLTQAYAGLLKRPGYIEIKESKEVLVTLLKKPDISEFERKEYTVITPELIKQGYELHLAPLDVVSPVPVLFPGRLHPVTNFINEVREILISMGFIEITGPIVQPSFWTFDALFTPQDHPAREMQDSLYLAGLKSKLLNNDLIQRISQTHENGWKTGSKGWRYKWSLDEAEKCVLRTHTTAISARYLAENPEKESRVFCIGKVFRNENLDATHLFEFTQIEAVISEKDATARKLLGYMQTFYSSLGFDQVRFRPTYFPYTEPSFEPSIYSKELNQWLEVGGSGVFRPEVTRPLGISNNVLAWGFGLERIALLRLKEDDLRKLYSNNLSWLRGKIECL
ncbi:MAG: phenylalanine--tRNA ligase subunit alpha, partial [Conexivisphaerales archaeon]